MTGKNPTGSMTNQNGKTRETGAVLITKIVPTQDVPHWVNRKKPNTQETEKEVHEKNAQGLMISRQSANGNQQSAI